MTPSSVSLGQGEITVLDADVLDAEGAVIANAAINFVSADDSVASVDLNGVVRTRLRTGTTSITVSGLGLTRQVPVDVHQRLGSVVLPQIVLRQLDSVQVQPMIKDVAGATMRDAQVVFGSTNPAVAAITQSGLVRSLGPAGSTVITVDVTSPGGNYSVAQEISITPVYATLDVVSPVSVGQGTSLQLNITVRDVAGGVVADPQLALESLDSALVRTTDAGVVYSVGALGQATVRVRSDTMARDISVTVVPFTTPGWNLITTLPGPAPWGVAAAANGTFIASGGTRGSWRTLTVSDTLPGAPVGTSVVMDATGSQAFFSFSPVNGIKAYDLATGAVAWLSESGRGGEPFAVALPATGGVIYHTSDPNYFYAVDTLTHQELWFVATASTSSHHIALHPTLPLAYVNGANGVLTEIDLVTHATRSVNVGGSLGGVAVSPDGSQLFVVRQDAATVAVYDRVHLVPVRDVGIGGECYSIVVAPDGLTTFVSCYGPGQVVILDGAVTTVRKTVRLPGAVRRLVVSPDGTTLLVAASGLGIHVLR